MTDPASPKERYERSDASCLAQRAVAIRAVGVATARGVRPANRFGSTLSRKTRVGFDWTVAATEEATAFRFAYDALTFSAFPNTNVPCRPGLVIACRRQVSRSAATNKPVASPTQIPVGPVCKLNAKINPVGIAAAQ